MKYLSAFSFLGCILILFVAANNKSNSRQIINPLLGDISFEKKIGHKPDANTNENLRIATHLEYVENLLRQKAVPYLSAPLQQRRMHVLNLLHQYRTNGVFPQNFDYPGQRKPCFIDKNKKICAVGYLVEQTASREVAESINEKYKYDELLAMNDKTLDTWVAASGLTKEECAMIQPTYGTPIDNPGYTSNKISTGYGVSSSVLGGVNLSLNAINAMQMAKGTGGTTVPVIGLISGAGQVVLGFTNMPKTITDQWSGRTYTNESQKTLSFINIGLGTTSMILSAWNLITNRKPKPKDVSWNVYSFPAPGNSTGVGVSVVARLGK